MENDNENYKKMWEDIGEDSGESYLEIKFKPTYRIGLTHYLREMFIYKFLNPQKEDVVVDVGCASGRQLFQVYDKIKKGYGTDIAESYIKKAKSFQEKKGIENLGFQTALIEKLPFEDEFFDKIICAEILEHVFDKDIALKEVLRILKKNGTLVVSVPNLNADATLWGRFLRLIKLRKFNSLEHFSQEELFKHGDSHVREFSKKSLTEWLEKHNLEVLEVKSVSFVDGPYFDFLLKVPLHIGIMRKMIIELEKIFTNLNLYFGRHLIVKTRKNN